jgi:hypothetical protein
MGVISLDEHRLRAHPDTYRRLLAAAILKLYRLQHGHGPVALDKYNQWRATINADRIDPFVVLTEKEVEELAKEK